MLQHERAASSPTNAIKRSFPVRARPPVCVQHPTTQLTASLTHTSVTLTSANFLHASLFVAKQEFVRPRWPYDMRPSVRAEKYICVIVIR